VPSQKFLNDEKKIKTRNSEKIEKLSFRGKDGFALNIEDICGNYLIKSYKSKYFYSFLNGYIYRENCYNCNYAKKQRGSDITLGDFWGLINETQFMHSKGINCILVNTKKGDEFIEQLKDKIFMEVKEIEEAVNGNAQLNHPTNISPKREIFMSNYKKYGYKKAMNKIIFPKFYLNCIKESIKINLKKNKIIYKFYKKIKKKV
jgi:coenzyme F420-reducing hydrogenase beta subunit